MRCVAVAFSFLATIASACSFGGEEPGCRDASECPDGFSCSDGACFRFTTTPSPPRDPADAGADADDGG